MTRLACTGQNIGLIASTWLAIADQSAQGIFDEDCLELARLYSDAADYPKSGRPVPLRDIPRNRLPGMKPDWNAPEVADGPGLYYTSRRFIGRLYREVQLSVSRAQPSPRRPLDEILNTPGNPSIIAVRRIRRQGFRRTGHLHPSVPVHRGRCSPLHQPPARQGEHLGVHGLCANVTPDMRVIQHAPPTLYQAY